MGPLEGDPECRILVNLELRSVEKRPKVFYDPAVMQEHRRRIRKQAFIRLSINLLAPGTFQCLES